MLNGNVITTYRGHQAAVRGVAWSPASTILAVAGLDQRVHLYRASDGKQLYTYPDHSGPIITNAWSPDGIRLASGAFDKTVRVWQAV